MFTSFVTEKRHFAVTAIVLAASAMMLFSAESKADTGFYAGGSVGQAAIEMDVVDQVQTFAFDQDDFAWHVYGGFNFGLILMDVAVEAGYVDLGGPSMDVLGSQLAVDTTGIDAFGVLGFDIGPIGVFAKAGMISWDAEASIDGFTSTDDGTDPAYGIGAKFGLDALSIRAEYELYDIEGAEDVSMISVGLVFSF